MKRWILLILLISVVLGCAKPEVDTVYKTKIVEVEVYKVPDFTIPQRPVLPVDLLTIEELGDHNAISRAYVLSREILEGYTDKLYNLLSGIKKAE